MDTALPLISADLAAWIRQARLGDREAFERILTAHQSMVLRVALRMLGRMEDAQDAAQEVFLKLHKSLDDFEEDKPFEPWLYRMTTNLCLDLLRARRQPMPLDFDQAIPPSAERDLLVAERTRAVAAALQQLPAKERAALLLREVEGLSTGEVAAVLQSSETTVRSQIYQARMKLRKITETILRRRS